MRRALLILTTLALLAGTSAAAQIGLPGVALPTPGMVLDRAVSRTDSVIDDISRVTSRLADRRLAAIDKLVRRNRAKPLWRPRQPPRQETPPLSPPR